MGQFQNVPGPSQDEFNAQTQAIATLNNKLSGLVKSTGSISIRTNENGTSAISLDTTKYIPIAAFNGAGYAVTFSIYNGIYYVRLWSNSGATFQIAANLSTTVTIYYLEI